MIHDKIKTKVQKLLNQAGDQEGTPEGEIFYQKAFDLMAEYGFEESDLSSDDSEEVRCKAFELAGTYTDMQARLLLWIATSLHCVGFNAGKLRSSKVSSVTVFGVPNHLARVEMLFLILNPRMLTDAIELIHSGPYKISRRRSFMIGFATSIAARLAVAEDKMGTEREEYGLALLDDLAKAQSAMDNYMAEQDGYFTQKRSSNRVDGAAFEAGSASASKSDIGQQRFGARLALAK